jgi:hypothetical protein
MSEDKKIEIEPFNEEELEALVKKLEGDEELDNELARAVFTILVIGQEYQNLYTTLQAYYAASVGACHDLAGVCSAIIGLKDRKKIDKMYKAAAEISGNIPGRAIDILKSYSGGKVDDNDN